MIYDMICAVPKHRDVVGMGYMICYMIWLCDMLWYDVIYFMVCGQCVMTWFDMIYDMIYYVMYDMIYDVIYDMIGDIIYDMLYDTTQDMIYDDLIYVYDIYEMSYAMIYDIGTMLERVPMLIPVIVP